MSEHTYNDQVVTDYLLGALPETEVRDLDELSFTDDKFADALKVAEKDLVDAYVQGELTGAALERFKSYYLASPLRLEKVQFAQAFQLFGERSVAAQAAQVQEQRAPKHKGPGWFSSLHLFTTSRFAWGTAFAALILTVAAVFLVVQNIRLRQEISQAQTRRDALEQREQELQKQLNDQRTTSSAIEQEIARVREERQRLEAELNNRNQQQSSAKEQPSPAGQPSIVSFVLAPQMRGVSQIRTVSIPAGARRVAMKLELEPNDYSAYSVVLLDASHRTVWRSGKVKPSGSGESKSLNVTFPAALLDAQSYVLQVSGVSAGGASEALSDFPFKVVK
jgi:hypothetical protein